MSAERKLIWEHSESFGVVFNADNAILVNRSGVITSGNAFLISGSIALIRSAILIDFLSFVSFPSAISPAFEASSFFIFSVFAAIFLFLSTNNQLISVISKTASLGVFSSSCFPPLGRKRDRNLIPVPFP